MAERYGTPARSTLDENHLESGQFTQQDPIGIAGGANVYGFAGGDPVNYADPFGLCVTPGSAIACIAAAKTTAAAVVTTGEAVATVGVAIVAGASAVNGLIASVQSTIVAVGKDLAADFVVSAKGVAVSLSQSRMEQSLQDAGMSPTPTDSPGRQYSLPNGMNVRAMEPGAGGNPPRRTSLENANGGPVNLDGQSVQPPRGLTAQARRFFVRERTHIVQNP